MDIHQYERRLELAIESVKQCTFINLKNRDLMLTFIEYKRAQGTSAGRCAKIMWTLKKFALGQYERRDHRSTPVTMMRDFALLTKDDIQHAFAAVESSSLKESTKRDYKIVVRHFIDWVFHEKTGSEETYDPRVHGYPSIFTGIRIKEPDETVKPSDLLTHEEKQRMIDAAKNLRDKALLGCLDEAGMRPGELLSLTVGDVTIEEQYGELSLTGKTGIRPSFIIRNLAYLARWLDSHRLCDDPEAPLWPHLEKPHEPLSYVGFRQMIKRVAVKAGIKKRVFPYLFRHTQATHDSTQLPEPILRQLYGWSNDSKVPSRYIHLKGHETRLAKLRQAGILVEPDKKQLRVCPRCNKPNPLNASLCYSCKSVMTLKVARTLQEERNQLVHDIEELKETVKHLVTMNMKVGQSRDDIQQLLRDREDSNQRFVNKIPSKYIAES
jgi:site-specific recombinase XerD